MKIIYFFQLVSGAMSVYCSSILQYWKKESSETPTRFPLVSFRWLTNRSFKNFCLIFAFCLLACTKRFRTCLFRDFCLSPSPQMFWHNRHRWHRREWRTTYDVRKSRDLFPGWN
jgi:hypothetical protein